MIILIGSSRESKYGVGSLLKWKEDEVKYTWSEDDGWTITEKRSGSVFHCYDVMQLEDVMGGGIEECWVDPAK